MQGRSAYDDHGSFVLTTKPFRRAALAGTIATIATLAPVSAASAQLNLPDVLGTVTGATTPVTGATAPVTGVVTGAVGTVTTTVGDIVGAVPDPTGGVVSGVTGSVGGILTGAAGGSLTDTLDSLLGGGSAAGVTGTLDQLLAAFGIAPPPGSGSGGSGTGGSTGTPGTPGVTQTVNGVIVDASAPSPAFSVRSHLPSMGKNGKLKIQITLDEPGVVVFNGAIRPGKAIKKKSAKSKSKSKAKAKKSASKLIKFPAVPMGFRAAGRLNATIQLGADATRALRNVSSMKLSISYMGADAARNLATGTKKLTVKR